MPPCPTAGKEKTLYVELAKRTDPDLRAKQKTESANELGLKLAELKPETARQLGFSEDEKGLLVTHVQSDSKGETAGIEQGDLVKEINHKPVNSLKDYAKEVGKVSSGDTVQILIKRAHAGLIAVKITA